MISSSFSCASASPTATNPPRTSAAPQKRVTPPISVPRRMSPNTASGIVRLRPSVTASGDVMSIDTIIVMSLTNVMLALSSRKKMTLPWCGHSKGSTPV